MTFETIIAECEFRYSRSGGKGGQHVNKVETKVELLFAIENSDGLNAEEKQLLLEKLQNKINQKGELILRSERSRSQSKNKEDALLKLKKILETSLKRAKRRKATRMPKAVREKILKKKKIQSEKKARRKKIDL